MRFGVCLGLSDIEAIPGLADIGYDYVEFPLAKVMELPDADFDILAERLGESILRSEAMNVFFPSRIRLTGDEFNPPVIETYVHQAVARAKRLGAQVLVLGSSGSRNVPPGFSREKAWFQLGEVLRLMDPIVGEAGLAVAIEPLNRKESNIINSLDEAFRLSQEVSRPNIRVLVDYYHFCLEEEPLEHIQTAGSSLGHVHLAKVEGRAFPTEPDEGYRSFFRALGAAGYDSRVSIEATTTNLLDDARRSRDVLRKLEQVLSQ